MTQTFNIMIRGGRIFRAYHILQSWVQKWSGIPVDKGMLVRGFGISILGYSGGLRGQRKCFERSQVNDCGDCFR